MARDSDGTTVTRVFLIIFTVLVTLLALASIGRTYSLIQSSSMGMFLSDPYGIN
jgi:hypothetical protein